VTDLSAWTARPRPERRELEGRYVRLEPLDPPVHGDELFEAGSGAEAEDLWRYLRDGPYGDRTSFEDWLQWAVAADDPFFYAARDKGSARVEGRLAFMRIDQGNGVIETGHILFGPRLARTRAATEAIYLQARHVFEDLGYRRFEWKCDHANAASVQAALRLGFRFEGVFRQHMVVKGRNRDTAWFAMLDDEWPARKAVFERWLAPQNFDEAGVQRTSLNALMREAAVRAPAPSAGSASPRPPDRGANARPARK
jgi:RimJ/RimL family protein N-acetyltransferase